MSAAEERLNELIRAARKQVEAGDRPQALRTLQKALDMDPDNESIREEMLTIERESAAMESFRRTRSARAHAPEGAAATAGEGFIEECLRRSNEATDSGDDIRALQELERARRQDPENATVQKRIKQIKRSIKANNLADLGMTRLRAGDPFGALEQARKIFEAWPSSPALDRLVTELEGFEAGWIAKPETEAEVEEIEFEEPEEIAIAAGPPPSEVEEAQPVHAPSRPSAPAREEAAIASIREKIARSSYADALAEARVALRDHPSNPVLLELASKLEKVAAPAVKVVPPAAEPQPREKAAPAAVSAGAPAKAKKFPLIPVIAAAAVLGILAVLYFVVLKPRPAPVVPTIQPYSATLVLQGPPGTVVNLDGNPIQPDSTGNYVLSGTDFGEKTVEARAEGYEVLTTTLNLAQGQVLNETLAMQPLGTSRVQVSFTILMPEGEPQPDPGTVSFLVDGQPTASVPADLPTGMHVFQATLEGYNSLPESILIDVPGAYSQQLALLSPETSQISLSLATGVTGNAAFFVDGTQVGTGRRITQIADRGRHSLRITLEGYEDWSTTINLDTDGYSQTVELTQITTTGRLLIGPEPWAEVSINGQGYGQTPMPPIELEPGTYTVTLSNPEYETQEQTVTIVTGEDVSIRYTADLAQPDIIEEQPVIPPFPTSQVAPEIPSLAAQRGDVHGYVTLDVRIGTDGSVVGVTVTNDPLGLGCGEAAAAAVSNWRFNPATQGGVPVEVTTTVQVRFDVQ
jgi:TonB family protein